MIHILENIKETFSESGWLINLWKRLNGGTVPPFKMHPEGTVPPYKMHPGGTVPPFKMHPGGTVPPFKMHPGGTVPPFKMHPGGTLTFLWYIFLSLILDCIAKINDRSMCHFLNLSVLSQSSQPPPSLGINLFTNVSCKARPYFSNDHVSWDLLCVFRGMTKFSFRHFWTALFM